MSLYETDHFVWLSTGDWWQATGQPTRTFLYRGDGKGQRYFHAGSLVQQITPYYSQLTYLYQPDHEVHPDGGTEIKDPVVLAELAKIIGTCETIRTDCRPVPPMQPASYSSYYDASEIRRRAELERKQQAAIQKFLLDLRTGKI